MLKRFVAFGVCVTALGLGTAVRADAAGASQTFFIRGTSQSGTVSASGPIAGSGKDITIDEDHDRFVFDAGSVLVTHHATSFNGRFDPATCIFSFTERGTYQLSGGTGVYRGVSGSGTFSASGVGVGHLSANGCSEPQVVNLVSARGTTNLP